MFKIKNLLQAHEKQKCRWLGKRFIQAVTRAKPPTAEGQQRQREGDGSQGQVDEPVWKLQPWENGWTEVLAESLGEEDS